MSKPYISVSIPYPDSRFEVRFEANPEWDRPEFNDNNHQEIETILGMIEKGQHSYWFEAKVTVRLKSLDITGVDNLSCCSFKSFEEFYMNKDIIDNMIKAAMGDLDYKVRTRPKTILRKATLQRAS